MMLISILNDLSEMEYRVIASDTFHHVVSKKSELRINKVCLFIQNNFYTKITLKQVAELVYKYPSLIIEHSYIPFMDEIYTCL